MNERESSYLLQYLETLGESEMMVVKERFRVVYTGA